MQTVKQFSIPAYDKPGVLAELTKTLGDAGVNLTAMTIDNAGSTAFIRFTADAPEKAESALKRAGFPAFENEAFLVELPNEPGSLGRLTGQLAAVGVNIETIYGTSFAKDAARLVFVVGEPAKAKPVFEGFLAKAR